MEHNESFDKTLQKLVDQGIVQFGSYPKEEYVASIEGSTKNPLVIPFQGPNLNKKTLVILWGESIETPVITPRQASRIPVVPKTMKVIRGPSTTPYKSDKELPWSYDSTVYVNGLKQECESSTSQEPVISNIAGTKGMTHSGRIFGSELQKRMMIW